MTQAEFNKMIVEAQKNYLKKRDEYLKDVKRFIGNMFKEFITEDFSSAIKQESSYNEAVNSCKNVAEYMDWFEAVVFRLMRWDIKNQITEIEELILGKATIASYKNNTMTYLATLEMLVEKLKKLKVNNLVEEHIILHNGRRVILMKLFYYKIKTGVKSG